MFSCQNKLKSLPPSDKMIQILEEKTILYSRNSLIYISGAILKMKSRFCSHSNTIQSSSKS